MEEDVCNGPGGAGRCEVEIRGMSPGQGEGGVLMPLGYMVM